ncbi:MAG: type IV secretory system conjugative DNA transfer family protein [Candidatus Ryanbacteria bacterium]|nr:type IV secretory system conjugative DNA transfer family protein [Candidatus Ryanbacteria bacterium]
MDPLFAGIIAASVGLALITALLFYFLVMGPRREAEVSGALGMVLYAVLIPQDENPPAGEAKKKEPKDIMIAMEQLYAALSSLKTSGLHHMRFGSPSITFEAALPHVGQEVIFYVAVPRFASQFFANQLNSFFPSAKVTESKDYNIFHPSGVSAGSVAVTSKNALLSLRTYHELGSDPLEIITGAFAKLKTVGDGAAIQVVVRPARDPLYQKGNEVARKVRAGASLKDALGGFGKELQDAVMGAGSKPKEEKRIEEKPKAADEDLAKQIETKASQPAFDVVIRIIASAATPAETTTIMAGLEAAFEQFGNPQGNQLAFRRVGAKPLEELLYRFSFRLFSESEKIYLSSSELASIFHLPYSGFAQPNVAYLKSREAPPPTNIPTTGMLLGDSVFRGESRPVYMADDDRRRHMYVIGQTGTGKSTFLKELARQDILAGRGVCFIDPHGSDIESLLESIPKEREDDVIYFNPGDIERPLGLNFLEYDTRFPEQKSLIVNELLDIFNKLYDMKTAGGPMFEQYFRNATMLVMEDPQSGNTLMEVSRVLVDKEFRDYKLSRSSNIVVNSFWQKIAEKAGGESSLANMVPYITSKFDTFLSNDIMRPIIAQEKSAFSFREAMDTQKILLINLSKGRLGELNSSLLGLIIVGRILIAALSRVDIADESARKDFFCYIDEFQNVTTKSIATILSEARKYRLSLIVAHQFLGQLEDDIKKAVFGNVGSMIAFRVGSDDGEFLEKQFSPVFGARDLLNIDNRNAYVKMLIGGQTSRAFNMQMRAPAKGDPAQKERVVGISRITYGRPRIEVEAEIKQRYKHV